MKSLHIGIMCGRMSPQIDNKIQIFPASSWKNEFTAASECGFDSIEWIFDLQKNPILDEENVIKFVYEKVYEGSERGVDQVP